jgi:S-adenosylmethionine:tRNA ribosyltransferase-isomerase
MFLDAFDYELPGALIAQTPVEPRDSSRLLVVDRAAGTLEHRAFRDIGDYLRAGDMLVGNNSRVIPARLHGHKAETGGRCELLLLSAENPATWRVLAGGRQMRTGTLIALANGITATIVAELEGAQRLVQFNRPTSEWLHDLGETPLPPYIHTPLGDPERYQTIYARPEGSAAAPTAGLHFTPDLLLALRDRGVAFETVTLHVGLDTFKPVQVDDIADHPIHSEWAELSLPAAERINQVKLAGGRLIAIGTTAVRTLETAAWKSADPTRSLRQVSAEGPPAACPWKPVSAFSGPTDLYIWPGYHYRVVDAMITNFHLPKSSLLMLVSAFTGHALMRQAYAAAIAESYRFYSFGDAMLIL